LNSIDVRSIDVRSIVDRRSSLVDRRSSRAPTLY